MIRSDDDYGKPIDRVLAAFPDAKPSGNGWMARCPCHDDRTPSLSIGCGDDGRYLVKCFAGCPTESIVAARGLTMADLMPPRDDRPRDRRPPGTDGAATADRKPPEKPRGDGYATIDAAIDAVARQFNRPADHRWDYRDAAGERVGAVLRWNETDGKQIRPVAMIDGRWHPAAIPEPRPLFRLPELLQHSRANGPILLTEGEKCCDAAESIGLFATTWPGGCNAIGQADLTPLAGRDVVLLPDNDDAGRAAMETAAETLQGLKPPATVRVVELPDLPEKGDIADWIVGHGDAAEPETIRDELLRLIAAADPEPNPRPEVLTWKPFPVDCLPDAIRDFVLAIAEAMDCDPAFIAGPVLVALAGAVGSSHRLQLTPTWRVPAVLWLALIAVSGSKKSPALKEVFAPFDEWQGEANDDYEEQVRDFKATKLRHQKQLAAWKSSKDGGQPPEEPEPPIRRRFFAEVSTIEGLLHRLSQNPRGLPLICDELAALLGSLNAYKSGKSDADSPVLLSLYNCKPITIDRKNELQPYLAVPAAAVSIVGGIQPQVFQRLMDGNHADSGMLARFMVLNPPRKAATFRQRPSAQTAIDAYAAVLAKLVRDSSDVDAKGKPRPWLVKLSNEAEQVFATYHDATQQTWIAAEGAWAAALSKLTETAARIALVLHLARLADNEPGDKLTVSGDTMRKACDIAEWLQHETARVYAMWSETPLQTLDRKLLEWLQTHSGAYTPRELLQKCYAVRSLKKTDDLRQRLQSLVDAGVLRWIGRPGGRGSRIELIAPEAQTPQHSAKPAATAKREAVEL